MASKKTESTTERLVEVRDQLKALDKPPVSGGDHMRVLVALDRISICLNPEATLAQAVALVREFKSAHANARDLAARAEAERACG